MGDAFNNYLMDPVKDAAIDSAVEGVGLGGVVQEYNELSGDAMHQARSLTRAARFINNNFFS